MAQPSAAADINFVAEEERILKFWNEIDAFQTSMKLSKGRPRYSFYDGPPFATGLPHYGHILIGTIKDIMTRWAYQSGYYVERRFGWDCHGLPVEYEIDKTLGIRGPEDVAKIGIKAYNDECRKIVQRYSSEWRQVMTRLARWIDFDNDYRTMYPEFMESIWWVFKELFNKGLVYRDYKVMPFSTGCNTPLSNFESGQNYKEVVDPAVIVTFPLVESPDVSIIAWTTTPWTLPSNLALCVHPDLEYVKVKDKSTSRVYIMMGSRLSAIFKTEEEYEILDRFLGKTLNNKKFVPIFDYFKKMADQGAFRVVCDSYVTSDAGTGVVQQAPYFGEDDQRICLSYGIITKGMKGVCPVDESGKFTSEVTDFAGMYVKDADKLILKNLKARGRVVHQGTVKHSYPFCWRSETPLLYKAVPSWFVRVEPAVESLLKCNSQTYWVPDFVKEKRFGNWLKDARDWNISRSRYWGNPIPLWRSDDGEETVCVGSIAELEELTGEKVTDLHREFIDHLTIPSKTGRGVLRRVPEVFDCWFESGSMPYGQAHFPFENKKEFEENFPADFVAEGIDQTRGWFYTLMVISTLLFGKPPFKNLICNGLVLAADGQKMSKRKKNYPDPMSVVGKYGADALRLYMVNSPVVRAENLRFKEEGVGDTVRDVFRPWYHAYRFLVQNVESWEQQTGEKFCITDDATQRSDNYMDRWILSITQSLVKNVEKEMGLYLMYKVMPRLIKFFDHLTNWYVRMNRKRLKGDSGLADCRKALDTLCTVIFCVTRIMAPFTPFITEVIYGGLKRMVDLSKEKDARSVHFLFLPKARESLIHPAIEVAVARMQSVIVMGRVIRDRKTLSLKCPLKEVVAIIKDKQSMEDLQSLEKYLLEELNVRKLTCTLDKDQYGVHLKADPEHRQLGKKLTTAIGKVTPAIKALTDKQIEKYQAEGSIKVAGYTLEEGDIRVSYAFDKTGNAPQQYEAHSDGNILVLLDVEPDQSMLDESVAREFINRVQKTRKKANLEPSDDIVIYYKAAQKLVGIFNTFFDLILSTIKQPVKPYPLEKDADVIITEQAPIKKDDLEITITWSKGATKRSLTSGDSSPSPTAVKGKGDSVDASYLQPAPETPGVKPYSRYVNAVLCGGLKASQGRTGSQATMVLDNPVGKNGLTGDALVEQLQNVFGLRGIKIILFADQELSQAIKPSSSVDSLAGKTIYLTGTSCSPGTPCPAQVERPVCHFANVEGNGKKGTLMLENPRGEFLSWSDMVSQVKVVLGLSCQNVQLSFGKDKKMVMSSKDTVEVTSLHGKTLFLL